jgi:peptide/nickel transport system permease protein
MRVLHTIALAVLVLILIAALGASVFAPAGYAKQFRDRPNVPPSSRFLLGTDELGRDRFSRLLFATRISLLLAPAAGALSTALAALIGTVAGFLGGIWERLTMAVIDVFLSLPWLFLLIAVRAMLPLNLSPLLSVIVTFVLLGLLGWAAAARVVCAGVCSIQASTFMLNARALGCSPCRLIAIQLIPNLKPVLWAQFLVSIPVFILAEANLSMLGLGVPEPLPSLGGLLADLENVSNLQSQVWRLAPLAVLVSCVSALQIVKSTNEVRV